ncbi:MAG: hypothetical protein Q4B22_12195 [Eubacteriales bacterium]|nr:hypothetical protein [Eubacteriales bacterium]
MDLLKLSVEERLSAFYAMIESAYGLPYWVYNADGTLLDTSEQERMALEAIFKASGCMRYMLEYAKNNAIPLVLSADLGLLWCAGFEYQDKKLHRIYVFGPAFHTNVSYAALSQKAYDKKIQLSWRTTFLNLMESLPIISENNMTRIAVMLHRILTDETLLISDVSYQQMKQDKPVNLTEDEESVIVDRYQTYMAERELLGAVREGNMNYSAAISRAQSISTGVPVASEDPMQQAQISVIVYMSLCTRAAIEGGLTPEKAYTTGDYYIQLAHACKNISELASVAGEMYREFIHLVHENKKNSSLSPAIQSCCDYIQMHPETDLSIEILAKR